MARYSNGSVCACGVCQKEKKWRRAVARMLLESWVAGGGLTEEELPLYPLLGIRRVKKLSESYVMETLEEMANARG